jgi:hypothetical protein
VARSGDRPQHTSWWRLRPSDRGPRGPSSTGFFTGHGAASDRLKVGENRLEPIASRILRAIEAGLQQVSQCHEVAFASATVLVTLPASIGSARVDARLPVDSVRRCNFCCTVPYGLARLAPLEPKIDWLEGGGRRIGRLSTVWPDFLKEHSIPWGQNPTRVWDWYLHRGGRFW